jgi:Lipid desaturase domain
VQTAPFFKDATRREIRVMRLFVGANIALILACAFYLICYFAAAGLDWPYLLAAALAGYFLADIASGAVHWGLDTWFDERMLGRAVAIAREHHTHPHHIHGYSFLEYAALGSAPSAVVFGFAASATVLLPVSPASYALMILWFMNATCMLFGMNFHNLAHRPAGSRLMRLAQRIHLVCPPAHHWTHHRNQTIHYCVVNGWANPLCDRLHFWRGLERAIQAATGLVPRADDLAWQQHYADTGILAAPNLRAPRRTSALAEHPSRLYPKPVAARDPT